MTPPFDCVFLTGFGGPPRAEDALEFVRGIVGDRGTEERIREVAHHYEVCGGSPFNRLTFLQRDALQVELERRGLKLPVKVGFKHWTPWIHETVAEMAAEGRKAAVGIVLAPHACYSSDDKYRETVDDARVKVGPAAPEFELIPTFGGQHRFIQALAARVGEAAARIGPERWARAKLVFSAHSVPIDGCGPCRAKTRACPYPVQYRQTAEMTAQQAGKPDFALAYQSRATMRTPWLEPDVCDLIRAQAAAGVKDVVVAPAGFVCDHVEVLYDLDKEARETAERLGVGFERAGTVLDHPAFVAMLADAVESKVRSRPRV